jgi:ParB/RepB/Spo0J family partition protein
MTQPFKYRIDAADVTRLDEFSVPPEEIIAEMEMNGRESLHSEESVQEMVASIIQQGQLQAVVCRKVQGSKLKLVLGFRRLRAIKRINENPELLNQKFQGQKLKIRVKVKDMNDEEAFLQNLTENMIRDDLTPLDHAHNQRFLRDRFHWTEERIARFYKQSVSYVSLLKKTHQIPSELQSLIREKKLTLSDGIDLTTLPEQEQKQVVQEATGTNGHVDSTVVRQKVRDKKIAEGGKKARTLREVRKFFETLKEDKDGGKVQILADDLLKFLDGCIKEETFQQKIREMVL